MSKRLTYNQIMTSMKEKCPEIISEGILLYGVTKRIYKNTKDIVELIKKYEK